MGWHVNILVTYLYDLGGDNATYERIYDLCLDSYKKNLQGVDRFMTFTGTIQPKGTGKSRRSRVYGEMLIDLFNKTHELWSDGANVLLVDGDTMCVRPTPWPEGQDMRLFNFANAQVYKGAFPKHCYLHSGVRYLPETMPSDRWLVGGWRVDDWNFDFWAYDQYVWNCMFWIGPPHRFPDVDQYVDPRYCWVAAKGFSNQRISIEEAYILHYCSTRGARRVLKRMEAVSG